MAGENTPRTFTEGEAYALVADAVERESAAARDRISELETENTDLKNQLDVTATQKASAEQAAEEAKKTHEDYLAEAEAQKAREALRGERTDKVKEVAPSLELSQERSDRIVAMSDEQFNGYLADLREAVPAKAEGETSTSTSTTLPRESAALKPGGGPSDPGATDNPSVIGLFDARRQAAKSA